MPHGQTIADEGTVVKNIHSKLRQSDSLGKLIDDASQMVNFTEAARQCFITQSTLSQQIKQLETELGVQLFERIGKWVFLTETGRDFLPYARQTVADADYGVQRIKDMEELKTGRLCIGTTFGLSVLITDAIARFSEQYPEVHLEVMFLKQDELIEAVSVITTTKRRKTPPRPCTARTATHCRAACRHMHVP